MKSSKIVFALIAVTLLIMFTAGCKKKSEDTNPPAPPANSTKSATDNALAENLYNNVKNWSDQAMAGSKLKNVMTDTVFQGTCVLATLDTVASNNILKINFGTTNCQCMDGKYRRGKIICTFTSPYWLAGTMIAYTFENYFVDDNQVLGTMIVTNMGLNSSNHPWWEFSENSSIVKANNEGTITWISTRQLEMTEGYATPFVWWDDVYQMIGEAHGVNSTGAAYLYNITTPLKKNGNCQWIVSGVVTLQVTGLPLITMDYGDGTCNNNANIIINGQTYPIILP